MEEAEMRFGVQVYVCARVCVYTYDGRGAAWWNKSTYAVNEMERYRDRLPYKYIYVYK